MTYGHWLTVDLGKQTSYTRFGAYSSPGDRPHKLRIELSEDNPTAWWSMNEINIYND